MILNEMSSKQMLENNFNVFHFLTKNLRHPGKISLTHIYSVPRDHSVNTEREERDGID